MVHTYVRLPSFTAPPPRAANGSGLPPAASNGADRSTAGGTAPGDAPDSDSDSPPAPSRADPEPESDDDFIPIGDGGGQGGAGGGDAGQGGEVDESALPWSSASRHIRSQCLRLHNEIVELYQVLQPSEAEAATRAGAVDRVTQVVKSLWPNSKAAVFGSYATRLYLPTSDIDMVVLDVGTTEIVSCLKTLGRKLVEDKIAEDLQVIAKARVPIVKFKERTSGIPFDISFEAQSGPAAAAHVQERLNQWPPLRPLIMVLKIFLRQRHLHEVYLGGLGSYGLTMLVTTFLQMHRSRFVDRRGELEPCLGTLLIDFFRLYGRSLNSHEVGISSVDAGCFFPKRAKGWIMQNRPHHLAIQDPLNSENDVGRGSFMSAKLRHAFDYAYQGLTAPCAPGERVLSRAIRAEAWLNERAVPPWPVPVVEDGDTQVSSKGHGKRRRGSSKNQDSAEEGELTPDERDRTRKRHRSERSSRHKVSRSGRR
ncbi:unnamed protein product [Ostreobium quekettii]|uniref:polynucleotide adenylyltransferase n=1 Tax=Ostreobium quekettii TaxID=121088 RepID=A0A8S1J1B6_9CHLO|nr:unnamed protein product [Ostreobium quekettii]|eukprot:evm.model.scf_347.7 EVM.evm.TU.scf_347.7   scf_347:54189-56746(+)